ncbi:MAG: hypothetical protein R3E91_01265 [Chlamydiales bacterium]
MFSLIGQDSSKEIKKTWRNAINIQADPFAKIQTHLNEILKHDSSLISSDIDIFKFYFSRIDHHIFEIVKPNKLDFVFKIAMESESGLPNMKARFENAVNAETLIRKDKKHHFRSHIIIPSAFFCPLPPDSHNQKRCYLMIEKKLDFDLMNQEYLYQSLSNEKIEVLAHFLIQTRLTDYNWCNNPILKDSEKIAFLDCEEVSADPLEGLFGLEKPFRRGLLGCLYYENQFETVLSVAKTLIGKNYPTDIDKKKRKITEEEIHVWYCQGLARREAEIAKRRKNIQERYRLKNQITDVHTPFEVDLESLNFKNNLENPSLLGKTLNIALKLIRFINEKIATCDKTDPSDRPIEFTITPKVDFSNNSSEVYECLECVLETLFQAQLIYKYQRWADDSKLFTYMISV